MKVLHCSWIPEPEDAFVQGGELWLWVEVDTVRDTRDVDRHPRHLAKADLIVFLEDTLGLTISAYERRFHIVPQRITLPTLANAPLPAPEFERGVDEAPPPVALRGWEVDAYRLVRPIPQLGELRFLALCQGPEARPGGDLLFWHYFTQSIKSVILRDRYIPSLVYRQTGAESYELHAGWEIVSDDYDHLIREACLHMPEGCTIVGDRHYEKSSLLRHCAEVLVQRVVTHGSGSPRLERRVRGTLVDAACQEPQSRHPWKIGEGLPLYQDWLAWRLKLAARRGEAGFTLLLQLREAATELEPWRLELLVAPRKDPSLQIPLADYWTLTDEARLAFAGWCGAGFDQNLLLALGQAARIYNPLWEGLDETQPSGIDLSLDDAFAFLQEDAWVLEDAGFTVLVPSWWTPQGRRRAKIRLQAGGDSPSGSNRRNALDLQNLIAYRYDLALGEETVEESEWAGLVESKSPLVRFRGRWLALDREKMREMLEFWRRHRQDETGMSLPDLMRKSAEDTEFFEIEPRQALAEMLAKLRDHSRLQAADNPPGLEALLRDYQKRGLAWIAFLESLGLNGCLADDMGLGKTVQVLARLVQERESQEPPKQTLLIAPTSVIGNWKKEIERFAPGLAAFIHHGAVRVRDAKAFERACLACDVVITSYALARRDEKILSAIHWRRVVLDEA